MTLVCLWSPGWETAGAERLAEHAATLLADAPRVALGPGRIWADARGLPARPLAHALLGRLPAADEVRAGIARVPIAADAAARTGRRTVTVVAEGEERVFLASLPLAVLEPERRLAALLRGAGVRTCGALAELTREAVEVRFGAAGAALWRLARADDPRVLFAPVAPEAPHASMDWPDTRVRDAARLGFAANALLGSVCEVLAARGERARRLAIDLALEGGGTLRQDVRTARPTAERRAWLARTREALERLVLPDAVVGLSLTAAEIERADAAQGDLFDRGFGSAAGVEEAVARLLDTLGPVVLAPSSSSDPRAEARTTWTVRTPADVATPAAPPSSPAAGLTLQLLPRPRPVRVRSRPRRDHRLPEAYRDGRAWRTLADAAGPDRISGGHAGETFAREYYRCVTEEGRLVWLYHDALARRWYLHGWWD